jgi:dipeptidyl aminopeptidase
VDKKRIGIWGWVSTRVHLDFEGCLRRLAVQSYGGFMSSKVVEANAGIHSLSMAVAVRPFLSRLCWVFTDVRQPVTSWRLYGECVRER